MIPKRKMLSLNDFCRNWKPKILWILRDRMNESRHCKINGGSFQVLGSLSTREQAVQYKYISSPGLTFNQRTSCTVQIQTICEVNRDSTPKWRIPFCWHLCEEWVSCFFELSVIPDWSALLLLSLYLSIVCSKMELWTCCSWTCTACYISGLFAKPACGVGHGSKNVLLG